MYLKVEDDDGNDTLDDQVRTLREAGHPRVTLYLQDAYAMFGEFFRWEFATAVAGNILEINPFDEPNVTESKNNTNQLLAYVQEQGNLPETTAFITGDHIHLYANHDTLAPLRELCEQHGYDSRSRTELLAAQISGTHSSDYFAILAYLPYGDDINAKLEEARQRLRNVTRRAVTLGYGPRYLHSTGQLHKGGKNNGVFIQITSDTESDIDIPDAPYSFGTLMNAQAEGDMQALQTHKRRVIRLHIHNEDIMAGLQKLIDAIAFVEDRRL